MNCFTVAAVVALRLAVGFHFFAEGVNKLRDPKPFSAGFFSSAKGPLAPLYHDLVWDPDGLARLNYDATSSVWQRFVTKATNHFGYNAEQIEQAEKKRERREEQLEGYLSSRSTDIDEYKKGLERRKNNQLEPARQEVPSLRGQSQKWESQLKADSAPWLAEVTKLSKDFERDLNEIATPEQRQRGYLKLKQKPGRSPDFDSESMDRFIPYFDLTVGLLLLAGLFTRVAAAAGAAFLASVAMSQWPGAIGAVPAYYQIVETFALLVLAGVGAGRYAGLDFFLCALRFKCCPPTSE